MKEKVISKILLVGFIISLIRYETDQHLMMDNFSLSISLVFALLSYFLYILSSHNLKQFKLMSSTCLIATSILIVYFFWHLNYLLGYPTNTKWLNYPFVETKRINESTVFSLCCFMAFLYGATFCAKPFRKTNYYIQKVPKKLYLLFLLFVFIFFAFTDKRYFSGGYGEFYNDIGMSMISALMMNFVYAGQIAISTCIIMQGKKVNSVKEYVLLYHPLYYVTLLTYYVLVIMSGDRGPVIYTAVTYIATYNILKVNGIKIRTIVMGILFASFFIAFLGVLRSGGGGITSDKIISSYDRQKDKSENTNIFLANTSELYNCVSTYNILYGMSDNVSLYGAGIVNEILSVLPGARFFVVEATGIDVDNLSTANIVTKLLDEGHGAGTACIGDVLINLGPYLTILFFFFYGYFLKKLDLSIYLSKSNFIILSLCLSYISFGIYVGRSHCFCNLNAFAYSILLVYFTTKGSLIKVAN